MRLLIPVIVAASSMLVSIHLIQNANASPLSKPTDGGSVTIRLEPSPSQIKSKEQTQMKISFMQPNTVKYCSISHRFQSSNRLDISYANAIILYQHIISLDKIGLSHEIAYPSNRVLFLV
jgi:hypothetical protein